MATLDDVLASGHLEVFELPDWELRCPVRPLYVSQDFLDWADETPALHDSKLAIGGRTLFEHLCQSLCEFRCVEHVHYSDLKRMMPTKKAYGTCIRPNSACMDGVLLHTLLWPSTEHLKAIQNQTKHSTTKNGTKF